MRIDRVVFNGKFTSATSKTGVHRVALELICALDRLLEERDLARDVEWVLLGPKGSMPPSTLKRIKFRTAGRLTWQFWEQIELPWLTRGDMLVSLCNLSPLAKRRSITMIHDAQTFRSPASYSWMFATYYRTILPLIGRLSARILTVSDFARRDLINYKVARPGKISVIHNGVDHVSTTPPDLGVIDRLELNDAPFVMGFASMQAHKNLSVLFEAFSRPELAGIRAILVGSGDRKTFESNGFCIPDNVVFAGRVSDAELSALFGRAICLAFPSTTEGFGLPPLEAMTARCPAVVAPCGALPEVCGDAALYAQPHEPAEWADAILQIQTRPGQRDSLVDKGLVQAAKFTWTKSAERLFEMIQEVRVEGGERSPPEQDELIALR